MTGHREAIALLTALIQQTLDQFETGGTQKLWRELSRTWRRAEAARMAGDRSRWRETYAKLGALIERGGSQVDREAELLSLLERRRKLVDSEVKREHAQAKTFTLEEVTAFYTGLSAAVRRHILDPDPNLTPQERLRRVQKDMAAIGDSRGVRSDAEETTETD